MKENCCRGCEFSNLFHLLLHKKKDVKKRETTWCSVTLYVCVSSYYVALFHTEEIPLLVAQIWESTHDHFSEFLDQFDFSSPIPLFTNSSKGDKWEQCKQDFVFVFEMV